MARKWTYDEVAHAVSSMGFKLISKEYIDMRTKLDIEDNDGYLYNVELGNFVSGRRPERYRKTNKYSLWNIQHYIELQGSKTVLLSNEYINSHEPLLFRCGACGSEYRANANHVISRKQITCPKCSLMAKGVRHRVSCDVVVDEFLKSGLTPIFTKYTGCDDKLPCIDEDGNYFELTYRALAQRNKDGYSTYKLSCSRFESMVRDYLKSVGLRYVFQYSFQDCVNIKPLPFDFAVFLSETNLFLIEVDGEQHFNPVSFGQQDSQNSFYGIKERDMIKTHYCENHGIKLLRLPYYLFKSDEWMRKIDLTIKNLQSIVA